MTASIPYAPVTGVIVTGGGSGIGAATMHALAEAGRPVAAWDLNEEHAERVAEQVRAKYGVAALGLRIDVNDTAAFASAIEKTRATLGTIGALAHVAGNPYCVSPIDELDEEVWDLTLSTHLKACALLIRDLSPDLKRNPGSAIVVIASIASIVGFDTNPAYCATKAGLLGLVRSSAGRLGEHNVRANAICPGFISTPWKKWVVLGSARFANRSPLRRMGQPCDIAAASRFLLSNDASFITATELVVDGGVTRTVF